MHVVTHDEADGLRAAIVDQDHLLVMAGELGEYQQLADAQVVDAIGAQQVDQALQSPIDEAHLLAVHHRPGRLLEVAGTELDVLQPTAAYRLEPVAGEYLPQGSWRVPPEPRLPP